MRVLCGRDRDLQAEFQLKQAGFHLKKDHNAGFISAVMLPPNYRQGYFAI